jgi:SAM-dependent methyltransferase
MTGNESKFNYDSIAADYAAFVDSAPFNALYERPAMISMLPDLDNRRILDAGCGSGWYAMQLLARGATVDGIDLSPAMVDYARARLHAAGSDDRVTLQVGDLARPLPFADAIFDGIVSPLVLHYMRDWRPALREMRRVLRPDGWLLFSTHHPAADAARFKTENYFATEHIVDHWDWVGRVEFYRRPLTEIVASLGDCGFVIERLAEPVPTEEFRITKPDSWARLMNQPEFLIILAKPAQ